MGDEDVEVDEEEGYDFCREGLDPLGACEGVESNAVLRLCDDVRDVPSRAYSTWRRGVASDEDSRLPRSATTQLGKGSWAFFAR